MEEPNHRHRRLLRLRRERPRRSTAEQRDERAALHLLAHSINSSARNRNGSGIIRPSALAVVKLMTRSNLVGCSTGMSAGFAPQNLVDMIGRAPPLVRPVWSIRHQTACFDVLPKRVHRRQSRAERQRVDAKAMDE